MIGELILDHDELSLPGLGTFVAEEVPAAFSDRGYTVNPPYRKLSFYQRPENDHLLIDFYAASNNVSFSDASLIIVRFLDEMKSILKEKKVVVMPGLGRLRATRENNFFFVPDADLDIYPDGFGLRPVSMKNHTESQAELSGAVSKLSGMIFSGPDAPANSETQCEDVSAGSTTVLPGEAPANAATQENPAAVESVETPVEVVEPAESAVVENDGGKVEHPEKLDEREDQGHFDKLDEREKPDDRREHRTGLAGGLKVLIAVIVLVLLALGVFLLLVHVAPGFIDSLLYSPEELEILNYPLS